MRHIACLDSSKIPREDEFHFKDRAQVLVDKWVEVIQPSEGLSVLDYDRETTQVQVQAGVAEKSDSPIAEVDWVIINKERVEAEMNGAVAITNSSKETLEESIGSKVDEQVLTGKFGNLIISEA